MPDIEEEQPGIEVVDRFEGGISWSRPGEGLLECRSHALRDDAGGVWVVDPLDGAGLDEELAALGDQVVGVIVLLDRHLRGSVEVARRHGARLLVPPGQWRRGHPVPADAELLAAEVDDCPFRFLPVVERDGQWLEWALWWPERELLVVPESLGTASYYRSRSKEPLAVHPVLRVLGPPRRLAGLQLDPPPMRLLVGHGDALLGPVIAASDLAIGEARRELPWYALAAPRHAVRWARAAVGIGRASC